MKFIKAETLKQKPDFNHLNFGENFTDYMLTMKRSGSEGWHYAAIEPFHNLELSPAAIVLNKIFHACLIASGAISL